MWFLLACGPAAVSPADRPGVNEHAVGVGDRLWWADGAGVVAVDPTDGVEWGRWEGPVEQLAADRSGVWVASGEALVRLDSAAREVGRWSDGATPRLVSDLDGAWVGWTHGSLWRCGATSCARTPWRGALEGLVARGDTLVAFDGALARRIALKPPEPEWTAPGAWSSAVIAGDMVVFQEADGVVGGLALADGARQWTQPLWATAAPVVVDGWTLVADADGVTSLDTTSGRPEGWRDRPATLALVAGSDGTVAAWDGLTAEVLDVPSGEPVGTLASDTPPVSLPCGWAVVVSGAAACYRW